MNNIDHDTTPGTDREDGPERTDEDRSGTAQEDRSGTAQEDRPGTTQEDRPTAVVLLSGGMDSATAAYEAADRGYDLVVLHTSYGQITESKEYSCARALVDRSDLPVRDFLHIETTHLEQIGVSSLTDESIDVDDADTTTEEVPSSYVPFRNANLLSMAVSYAEARECTAVFVGAHSEDYSGYPDCRPAFFEAFEAMVDVGTKPSTAIDIEVPFVHGSKVEILERGLELDVPFEETWSCYRANEPACGTCDACAYRLQAFQRLDERDPIPYDERPTYVTAESRPGTSQ